MSRILTLDKLNDRKVKERFTVMSTSYVGKAQHNIDADRPIVATRPSGKKLQTSVVMTSGKYLNSESYNELWTKIEDIKAKMKAKSRTNVAQFPDDYYDLINAIRIDITRRRMEQVDYTSLMSQVMFNPSFSKSVSLDEFRPYAGVFKEITGRGENVPMIQQKTGETGSVLMKLYGLGHQRTLEDELYNIDIYDLQNVNAAVARGHTATRNNLLWGPILDATFDATQLVAADITGEAYDLRLYRTINEAIRVLGALIDGQTGQEIDMAKLVLAIGTNAEARDLGRVLNGQLNRAGTAARENVEPLEIDEIWKYKGDTITVGPDAVSFDGIPKGYAYLFVPGPAGAPLYTLEKRGLTQEVGAGDVLKLEREKRAFYFGQTNYMKEFLGATDGSTAASGYIVKIALPSFTDPT